jgi:glycosyltransferase involved in cell wall biosynthesis
LDTRVNLIFCADLREKWLPPADFIVATSWRTANFVAGYSAQQGKKLYLLQHLETFGGPYEDVVATWKLPLQKLTIAKWLSDFAESVGETSIPVRVGVDLDQFGLDQPIPARRPLAVMMYGDSYVKASWDGINALEVAKERIPELRAVLFGTPTRPPMPDWIDYIQSASAAQLRQLYNEASLFVHPSWAEGWPAPPAEAMACGAAVVAAANPGIMDYIQPAKTALMSRPKYWTEIAENIVTLLTDEALRSQIAQAGNEDVKQYSWEHAQARFAEVLLELSGHGAI